MSRLIKNRGLSQVRIKGVTYDIEAPRVLAFNEQGIAKEALRFSVCTQAEYEDAGLFTKQPNTLYFVKDGPNDQFFIPVQRASNTILGGVTAEPVRLEDTIPVRIDKSTGRLYTPSHANVAQTAISANTGGNSANILKDLTIGTTKYSIPEVDIVFLSKDQLPEEHSGIPRQLHEMLIDGEKWIVSVAGILHEGTPEREVYIGDLDEKYNVLIISGYLGNTQANGLAYNPDFTVVASADKLRGDIPENAAILRYSLAAANDDGYDATITFGIQYDHHTKQLKIIKTRIRWSNKGQAEKEWLTEGGISEVYAI